MKSPDDKYLIIPPAPPPSPELRQPAQHRSDQTLAWVAIGVALLAAMFTGFQAWQAYAARNEATRASQLQAKDVERSRTASESSALAANLSAGAAWAAIPKFEEMARAQRNQTNSNENLFRIDHTPSITFIDASFNGVFKNSSPKLQPGHPITAMLGIRVISGSAESCTLKYGAFFASSTQADLGSHFVTFPAVIGITPGATIELPLTSETPDTSIKAETGTVRFYIHSSLNCRKILLTPKPFNSNLCLSFPVSPTGEVTDGVLGCKLLSSLNP